MLGVIALGGQCKYSNKLIDSIKGYEFAVAADSGYRHFQELGVIPDALVGDMDSIPPDLLKNVRQGSRIDIVEYDTKKNMTDGEIAVNYAITAGCSSLILIGAFGDRIDHVLANQLLAASLSSKGIACTLTDGITFIYTISRINSPFLYSLKGLSPHRDAISVVPIMGNAENLKIVNLEYYLNESLDFGSTRAVSNTVKDIDTDSDEYATISLSSGVVFFILGPAI